MCLLKEGPESTWHLAWVTNTFVFVSCRLDWELRLLCVRLYWIRLLVTFEGGHRMPTGLLMTFWSVLHRERS